LYPIGVPRWLTRLADAGAWVWRALAASARRRYEGETLKPVTHPRHRARLLQYARRLRFEGTRIRNDNPEAADRAASATLGSLPSADAAELWIAERDDYAAWHAYAASILEAGAGGVETLDGLAADDTSEDTARDADVN
jgi:hypothetical protein